jgi:hypothetical protein
MACAPQMAREVGADPDKFAALLPERIDAFNDEGLASFNRSMQRALRDR